MACRLNASVAHEQKDLSYRLFDPDEINNPKVLIKSRIADEGLHRPYMVLFDLDETLVHCDIKSQVKQSASTGQSLSEAVSKVTECYLD